MPAPPSVSDLVKRLRAIPVLGVPFADRNFYFDFEPPSKAKAPILIFVHGTWGSGTDWVKPESDLRQSLDAGLKDSGYGTVVFTWSGLNGARPRLDAADALVASLDKELAPYGDSPVVAIGHSHGGNLIAWASTRITRPLRAAVYMNTPFMHFPTTHGLAGMLAVFILFIGLVSISNGLKSGVLFWFAFLVTLVASFALPRYLDRIAARLSANATDRHVDRELAVSSSGDEVGVAFSTMFLLTTFLRIGLIVVVTITLLAGGAFFLEMVTPAEAIMFSGRAVLALCLVATIVFLIGWFNYGIEQAVMVIEGAPAVTPAPKGQVDLFTLVASPVFEPGLSSIFSFLNLQHTYVCDDRQAIAHITDWVVRKVSTPIASLRAEGGADDEAND